MGDLIMLCLVPVYFAYILQSYLTERPGSNELNPVNG